MKPAITAIRTVRTLTFGTGVWPRGWATNSAWLTLLIAVALAPASAQDQWHPGLIDQQTRALAAQAKRNFEHCIVEQLNQLDEQTKIDPRQSTNYLINRCAEILEPIAKAHQQSDVPEQFTRQFVTKIKNNTVRQLLPIMQRRAAAAG